MAVLVCDKENQLEARIGKLIRCQRYFRSPLGKNSCRIIYRVGSISQNIIPSAVGYLFNYDKKNF